MFDDRRQTNISDRGVEDNEAKTPWIRFTWVGVCGPLPKTLALFMTKIYDFPYPIYGLTKIRYPIYYLTYTSRLCFRPAL